MAEILNRKERNTMNRQQRRAQKCPASKDAAYEAGYRDGLREKNEITIKMIYAAFCLVLNRRHKFGQNRLFDVLTDVNALMSPGSELTTRGAIDEVYRKTGLLLNFDDPFEPVEKVGKSA